MEENCNIWRNYNDINASWKSVTSIIEYYNKNQDTLIPAAGPGHFNDPDMVRDPNAMHSVGTGQKFECSGEESQAIVSILKMPCEFDGYHCHSLP